MKALVYKLVEGDQLTPHEAALREAILSSTGGPLKEPLFSLSPASGCMKFFDRQLLWRESKRTGGKVPTRMSAVAKITRDFFGRVNSFVARYRSRTGTPRSELPDPFPIRHLKHVSSTPMLRDGDIAPDHWLSTWMLHLPPFAETDHDDHGREKDCAPVFGAVVEVRVGANNQIVGLVSSVRVWSSSFAVEAFSGGSHDHPPVKRDEKGRLIPSSCFVLDSPLARQQFLAPFLTNTHASGHHYGAPVLPTCIYSLMVEIGVKRERDKPRAELFALIMDDEGEMAPTVDLDEWSITWFYQRFDKLFHSELVESTAATLTIDQPGVYHVEVFVEHRSSGACRSTHQQVILGGNIESEQEPLV